VYPHTSPQITPRFAFYRSQIYHHGLLCSLFNLTKMSGFWDFASSVGQSVQQGAAMVVQSAQQGYSNLVSYPETAQCTKCHTVTVVPANTFAWKCKEGHQNTPLDYTNCSQCPATKSESKKLGIYQPMIVCSNIHCAQPISLSETSIGNSLWTAVVTTPYHAQKAANSVVEGTQKLARPPEIFSCRFCNSQLYTPTGAWTCFFDNCNTNNAAGTQKCSSCQVWRYSAGVTCSVCSRSTPVPSSKFVAEVEHNFANAVNAASGLVHYAQGSTCAKCHTCQAMMQLEKEQVRIILGIAPGEPVPGFDEIKPHQQQPQQQQQQQLNPNEEDIFAKLNEEEKPLASDQPSTGAPSTNTPTPQDILCQKCLHLNTVSKDDLTSRKIQTAKPTAIQLSPEEMEQKRLEEQQKQHNAQKALQIQHVDDNGVPIRCIHCNCDSNILKPVTPCTGCQLNWCRTCAPYTRNGTMYCLGCAVSYDNDMAAKQQQQQQQQQQTAHVPPQQPASPIPQQQNNDTPYEELS